jgi:MoaA/NifB/PqqE/SkfB family radical SAM enzyme
MNVFDYGWDVPVENKTSIENYLSTSCFNPLKFSIFRPLCYFHFPRFDISKIPVEEIEKFIVLKPKQKNIHESNYNGSSRFLTRNEKFGTVIYDRAYFRYFLLNQDCKDILKSGALCESSNYQKEISLIINLADIPLPLFAESLSLCDKENACYDSPFKVFFEITSNCNMNCQHCLNRYSNHKSVNMPMEIIFQYFDRLRDGKVSEINITGGEPFLHPNITGILDYAIKIFPGLSVSTNGTLLNESILTFLHKINLRYLNISLDGTEKSRRSIRHGFDFKMVFDNIILSSQYLPTGITITLNRYNIQEIESIIELAKLNHIDKINFGLTKRTHYNDNNDLLIESAEQLFISIEKIESLCSSNNITYYLPPDLPFNRISEQKFDNYFLNQNHCTAGRFTFRILANETIMPCAFFPEEILYEPINITANNFFSRIREQTARNGFLENKCSLFGKNCMGGCPSRHLGDNNCDKYCMQTLNNIIQG